MLSSSVDKEMWGDTGAFQVRYSSMCEVYTSLVVGGLLHRQKDTELDYSIRGGVFEEKGDALRLIQTIMSVLAC
jgi:hypothetical protein